MGPTKSLFHTSFLGLNNNTMKYETKCTRLLLLIFSVVIVSALFSPSSGELQLKSKSILCADAKCESLYGKGHTITKYPSAHEDVLSFKKDVPVKIFGKTEDNKYMFVEINKSRGFVPAQHVLEDSIVNPALTFNVDFPTDSIQNQPNASIEEPPSDSDLFSAETPVLATPSSLINDQPDPPFVYTSKSATVIEGTTFYEDILKTATPSPTYPSESATTKTATIEANFDKTDLKQQNVVVPDNADVSSDNTSEEKTVNLDNNEQKTNLSGEENKVESSAETISSEIDSTKEAALSKNEKEDVKIEEVDDNQIENVESQNIGSDLTSKDNVSVETNASEQLQQNDLPIQTENEETKPDISQTEQKAETLSAFNFNSAAKEEPEVQNEVKSDVPASLQSNAQPEEGKQSIETENSVNTLEGDAKTENVIENVNENNETNKDVINENEQSSSEVLDKQPIDNQTVQNVDEPAKEVPSNNDPPKDNSIVPPTSDNVSVVNDESVPKVEATDSVQPIQTETVQNNSSSSNENVSLDLNVNQNENLLQPQQAQSDVLSESVKVDQSLEQQPSSPTEQLNLASEPQQANLNSDSINPSVQNPNSLPPVGDESSNLKQGGLNSPTNPPSPIESGHDHHPHKFGSRFKGPRYPHSAGSNPSAEQLPQQQQQQQQLPVQNNLNLDSHLPSSPPPNLNIHSIPSSETTAPPPPAYLHSHPDINSPPVSNNIDSNQPSQAQPDLYQPVSGNLQVDAKIIPNQNEQFNWNKPQENVPTNGMGNNPNNNSPSSESFPASDNLENYTSLDNTSGQSANRKLLSEKVFGGAIRDIIPDEVELFFESFGIPGHVFLFTSLVAFFWCSAKVVISLWNSSRKERELRDLNSQIQRKIYFFEADKDKLKKEATTANEKLFNNERDLRTLEKRKSKLEIENEQMKNELQMLRNENAILRNRADETPQISSRLDSTLNDFEKAKLEKRDLELKIDELEDEIALHKESIKEKEKLNTSQNEKIKSLNDDIKKLSKENDDLKDTWNDTEQSFIIVQSENQTLKAQLSNLNEEMRNSKDDMLLLQGKLDQLETEKITHLTFLEESKEKIQELLGDLELKQAELASMEALLSKLNKNISKESKQRRQSNDLNGDITDAVNGDNLSDGVESPVAEAAASKSEEEADRDLQDIVKLQLNLTNVELEKKQVEAKLEAVQKRLTDTNSQLENIKTVNDKLKEETELARTDRLKAVTELEVLSKYYKEKELEYGKEIGVQRVKREQKEEDATSMASRLEVTVEENEILKKQLESTKKELELTERRYKSQLNQLEKQSHENWIAARNAERKFEESKAEATALRQTLTFSVKSPPPADLSLTGFLDDTASSISSLPDGLNTSIHLSQLPPPPPPPPLMMMNSLNSLLPPLGAIPPPPGQPPIYGDMNDSSYWNSSAAAAAMAAAVSSAANPNLANTYTMVDAPRSAISHSISEPSSLVFVQAGQMPSYAQQPMVVPPANHNQQQQSSVPSGYQQYSGSAHPVFNHWEDLNRNTYSPALSQRSTTATPLTVGQTSTAAVNSAAQQQTYNMQQSGQQSTSQQYQQYQQHYGSNVQINNIDPNGANNTSATPNPYSISNFQQASQQQQQQQQQQYPQQTAYQQQSLDVNSYSSAPAATLTASQSHQIWTAGQPLPPGSDPSLYYAHQPQHAQHHANGSFGGPMPAESNSRPASVHTQMV